ncbi:MAG: Maf family protein [Candidatus Wildermuthbacteria bacterium]|nr:Maf family protein [Candidatus Wildermuthbacteria bacterium]
MKIILGSASKWRKDILTRMGYEFVETSSHLTSRPGDQSSTFEVMAADIDEKAVRFSDPQKLVLALANAKADALLPKIKEEVILITSDQVDVCNGEIREKPKDAEQAREFLRSYNKYPVEAVTAVVAVNTANQKRKEGVDIAKVWLRPFSEKKIEELVADGCVFSCAGGYCIAHPLFKDCVEKIEGEFESVVGLPKKLTWKLIQEALTS